MRLPVEDHAAYEAAARKAGLSLSDYIAVTMAAYHGRTPPRWIPSLDRDPLPLNIAMPEMEAQAA